MCLPCSGLFGVSVGLVYTKRKGGVDDVAVLGAQMTGGLGSVVSPGFECRVSKIKL